MRRLLLLALLTLLVTPAFAAYGPTLFFYKAGPNNLICAVSGAQTEPVTLLFADGVAFSEELTRRLGVALFPGDDSNRAESLRSFHEALRERYDVGPRGSGFFTLDSARSLIGLIDAMGVVETLGPARVVNLNRALEARAGTAAIRDFFVSASQVPPGEMPAKGEAIDRCRPALDAALRVLANHTQPATLVGFLRGLPNPAQCGAAAEPNVQVAATAIPVNAPEPPPVEPPASEPIAPTAPASGCGKAVGWTVLILAVALVAAGLWWRRRLTQEARPTLPPLPPIDLPAAPPEAAEPPPAPGIAVPAAPKAEIRRTESSTIAERTTEEANLDVTHPHVPASLAEDVVRLKSQLAQVTKALLKVNQRIDAVVERMGGGDLAARVANLENATEKLWNRESRPPIDQPLLKRINELELMVGQALGEMGRQVEDVRRQLARLELPKG